MKESEQELHKGAKTLECTMRGVLREQHLEKYISPHHWESLVNGPRQVGLGPEPLGEPPAEAAERSHCVGCCLSGREAAENAWQE